MTNLSNDKIEQNPLSEIKRALVIIGAFSLVVAVLQFVNPIYMLSIYNRVLGTRSMETLQAVSLIAVVLIAVQGIAEFARNRVVSILTLKLNAKIKEDLFHVVVSQYSTNEALKRNYYNQPRVQPLADMTTILQLLNQGVFNIFFDTLLSPLFLIALFIMSPLIGTIAVATSVVLILLAIYGELNARPKTKLASDKLAEAGKIIEGSLRQEDSVYAMGMAEDLFQNWNKPKAEGDLLQDRAKSFILRISSISKSIRMTLQIAVLGFGAYLVLTSNHFLAGAIIACSIIMGRALAPIDQAIGLWKPMTEARAAYDRLRPLFQAQKIKPVSVPLPEIAPTLSAQAATIVLPGQTQPIIHNLDLNLDAGDCMAIMGLNAVGKTTLLRALCGLQATHSGKILLGGVPVSSFSAEDRSNLFGYLPQTIQLFPGTIAQNIARFKDAEIDALHDAAKSVDAFNLIQSLPRGYETPLERAHLSAGQSQLIGLARAVYGEPKFLFLDEPTANLDDLMKNKFGELLMRRREAGKITIFVTHSPDVLRYTTHLVLMNKQNIIAGKTQEVVAIANQQMAAQ